MYSSVCACRAGYTLGFAPLSSYVYSISQRNQLRFVKFSNERIGCAVRHYLNTVQCNGIGLVQYVYSADRAQYDAE